MGKSTCSKIVKEVVSAIIEGEACTSPLGFDISLVLTKLHERASTMPSPSTWLDAVRNFNAKCGHSAALGALTGSTWSAFDQAVRDRNSSTSRDFIALYSWHSSMPTINVYSTI